MNEQVLVAGQVPTVRDDEAHSRYLVQVGGGVVLGRIDYRLRGHVVSLMHTEVNPDRKVPGLARLLVHGALEDIRRKGHKALPFCPYVRKVIAEEPDRFLDLVPAERRADFDLP